MTNKLEQEHRYSIHTIASSGLNASKLNRKKVPPLSYDKYFVGRSYQLFKNAIRSQKSLQLYKQQLYHFCHFIKMSTEEIVLKYGDNNNVNESLKLQHSLEDYLLLIQTRVSNGEINSTTAKTMIPPIRLLCEMNDIILNWKKINRLLPRGNDNATDEAYSKVQIKKMLDHSDLRAKIPILFMASGGMRLGGFVSLTDGVVKPIYDDKNGKLLAAHVVVYKGTDDEYDTFVSPEAFHAYEEYLKLRIKFGEKITKNSPILLRRFDISADGEKAAIDNTKPVALSTVAGIIGMVAYKAGVREVSEHYNNRYNIKVAHGFRKFFNTTLRSIKTKDGQQPAIQYIHKEWMMGHALTNLHAMEENYDRSDRVKILLEDYLKAVPELIINDEERLKVEVRKLETDISNMKTVSVELEEKDKQIKAMENKHEQEMKAIRDQMNQIMIMIQHNPQLAKVKPEALVKKKI